MGNLIIPFLVDIRRVWTGAMAKASVASSSVETWNFSASASWTLVVVVNGAAPQTLIILRSGFADASAATAVEVAAQIDAGLSGGGSYALTDGAVAMEADLTVTPTTLQVTGGTANTLLAFPTTAETQAGYNDLLGGVRAVSDGTQRGVSGRREHAVVTVRCQMDRARWGEQQMTAAGTHELADIVLTLDMRELERRGLTRSDGAPRFSRGDRIERIRTIRGVGVESFPDPQGVRVENVERAGHGLSLTNPRPNLVYLHCSKDRVIP